VPAYVNTFFEKRVKDLRSGAVGGDAFSQAGLEYRVVGGLAAYLYEEWEPDAGRLIGC